jgi:hypothetical protein
MVRLYGTRRCGHSCLPSKLRPVVVQICGWKGLVPVVWLCKVVTGPVDRQCGHMHWPHTGKILYEKCLQVHRCLCKRRFYFTKQRERYYTHRPFKNQRTVSEMSSVHLRHAIGASATLMTATAAAWSCFYCGSVRTCKLTQARQPLFYYVMKIQSNSSDSFTATPRYLYRRKPRHAPPPMHLRLILNRGRH